MKDKTEIIHKEIDLLQACITRMANNSFLIKGWAITLVSLILTINNNHSKFNWFVIIPVLAFWYLDAFFLKSERLYRKQYDWVIVNRENTNENLYELNPSKFQGNGDIWKIIISKSLLIFYGMLIVLSLFLSYCILGD
ncbi:hypothetical protein [Spirabiliibacterium falconis]|uniref:hypothetical protein n=1 Tax=Spirabiliibacterium falconis TaxID=572023 RepID=UPI001AAD4C93|nr:hypothetical protein [Spirabiliibacterium falconis]MBE2893508.1 hypothetical protein [Spirabiliibacterium falconis]